MVQRNLVQRREKIVYIINEAVTLGGMSKRDTDALKDALRALVSCTSAAS
jgi:hypothetical protein